MRDSRLSKKNKDLDNKKPTKGKEQEKHPVEPAETARHEEKLFSYTYRKTGRPVFGEIQIADNKFIWGIQAKSQLTQMHNLFINAMLTLGFKNSAFAVTFDTVIAKVTETPALVAVVSLKELRRFLPKKLSINSFQEIQKISQELIQNCIVNLTLADKETQEIKFTSSSSIVLECGYISDDIEIAKVILPDNNRLFSFIQENKIDLNKINKTAKPKETGNLFITLSPVYVATLFASKVRLNYSTVILKKFKEVSDGLLLSVVKYIISQQAPYKVSVDKLLKKILKGEVNKTRTIKIISTFKQNLANGKFKSTLNDFGIIYIQDKDIFEYQKNIKGVGFSKPFDNHTKKLIKAEVVGGKDGEK